MIEEKELTLQDKHLMRVMEDNPHADGNNTEICIAVWKDEARERGISVPIQFWDVVRAYKPESVTRRRRNLVPSTEPQRDKEEEYHDEYRGHRGL